MKADGDRIREFRDSRQWSQDQLAKLSGLNLRTIQRLESGSNFSTESLRALAAVFEVPAESLLQGSQSHGSPTAQALEAMRAGVLQGLEFTGQTSRTRFWWFALLVSTLLAFATLLTPVLGPIPLQIVSLLVFIPWIAACTRRLRDASLSPWWLLISLVPVAGILVLLYLLCYPTNVDDPVEAAT